MFFDKNHLSAEQLDRWHPASVEFKRIVNAELYRQLDSMTEDEKLKVFAKKCVMTLQRMNRLSLKELNETVWDHLREAAPFDVEPGNPRSALFARLRDGEAPLEKAPPTNFGYPWYEIVTSPKAFPVKVQPLFDHYNHNAMFRDRVEVNGCEWLIHDTNTPADTLMLIQPKLPITDSAKQGEMYSLLERAYIERPEFIVKHPGAGDYRLTIYARPLLSHPAETDILQNHKDALKQSVYGGVICNFQIPGLFDINTSQPGPELLEVTHYHLDWSLQKI